MQVADRSAAVHSDRKINRLTTVLRHLPLLFSCGNNWRDFAKNVAQNQHNRLDTGLVELIAGRRWG